jgi:hypothetical protein
MSTLMSNTSEDKLIHYSPTNQVGWSHGAAQPYGHPLHSAISPLFKVVNVSSVGPQQLLNPLG